MSATAARPSRLNRRLLWRLLALFVVGALLPVALSDWLVITVTGDLASELDGSRRAAAARAASREVFDRMLTAKALLTALADSDVTQAGPGPGDGTTFAALACGRSDDPALPDASLLAAWSSAHLPIDRPLPSAASAVAPDDRVRLRVQALTEGRTRVLMGVASSHGRTCVAEFQSAYLWAPLREASEDSAWIVRDERGRVLVRSQGLDAVQADDRVGRHTSHLFLESEFGAANWTFIESAPIARPAWHDWPIVAWLSALAAATLLAVGLYGQWRLRRTLAPLEQLTEGTRRLAAGEAGARVNVQRDDELGTLATCFNDMAGQLEARERTLVERAVQDDLTGLWNRFGLHQKMERMLAEGAAQGVAVLFIDLDRFKDVNDTHGHAAGDEVLRLAAARLQRLLPADTILARKGGDEFVIVAPRAGRAQAVALAAAAIAAMTEPFHVADREHLCGASVGIALAPAHGRERDELLRCADIALYEAKGTGRGRHAIFTPALDLAVRANSALLSSLRHAVERREFVVHFQPRVDVRTGVVSSAEALVRWQHPERGLVMPGEFIEMIESSGLVDAMGAQVLEMAVAQVARWDRDGVVLERLSVNVSPRQFVGGELPALVRQALLHHGVAPARLELEVTESLLSGDVASVRAQLQALRELGISIAMDDFGTGYSSLALLRQLPIDWMKIDRSFVKDIETDAAARAIASTIVTLAKALELGIVAEGIETPSQAEMLAAMGCDEFQGYLYSRPVPADAFLSVAGVRQRKGLPA